jgi:sarcosine oxidase subunit gamma
MSRPPLDPRPKEFPLPVSGRERAALRLDDLSERSRFGCKGPGAEKWLIAAAYDVPQGANSARMDAEGVLVARLATSEFLVEAVDSVGSRKVDLSARQLFSASRPRDVYPVARQDLVVGLRGAGMQALLRQVCSVDFVPLFESAQANSGPIILTSMAGVGVVAWPRRAEDGATLTLWVDPSFAHYFWTTLLEVGGGVGAMVIGSKT